MSSPGKHPAARHARGLSIIELLALMAVVVILLGFGVPILQHKRCDAGKAVSIHNLQQLAAAHGMYAADWNERQFTMVRDDLGVYGGHCALYQAVQGCHPPLFLGDDCEGVTRGFFFGCGGSGGSCDEFDIVRPINFSGPMTGVGSFRIPNARGFHEYLNGRFLDPVFFAPKDEVVLEVVEPLLDEPCEYPAADMSLAFASSYVLSPAAMYHPEVLANVWLGGFSSPDSFAGGYESPAVTATRYPDLKSRMLEHHLLQIAPQPCNPRMQSGSLGACEPYYFNHSWRSRPVVMFYDGHVDAISVMQAEQFDDRIREQTNWSQHGIWSRDTPLGSTGYFSAAAFDFAFTSFHILTTDGIRGRDTLAEP